MRILIAPSPIALFLAAQLLAAQFVASVCFPCVLFADSPPNILLIVSEDNGPELGCYGDPYAQTPVLDQLAADGVRFDRAFVPQAGCSQSRAALLTGLYPHENGQIGLATWKFQMYDDQAPNLVKLLKGAGYRTGIIGKLHINPASAFPFDFKKISTSNFSRKKLGEYSKHAETFFNSSDEPFFLSVNYPDAHRPFIKQVKKLPAEPLTGRDIKSLSYFGVDSQQLRDETANYYNCMSRIDSLVGDLLDSLARSGKSDDTLVVYMGDHGADLLRGKRTSYEGGLRVPLIVRWPGHAKENRVRRELVSTLDIMPTMLDVANIQKPHRRSGRSLAPMLRDEKTSWRSYLFTEYHLHSAHNFYPQRTVRDDRFKLIHNLMPDQVNPGYDFTINRFYADLPDTIEKAPELVRAAYHRMRRPAEFELYDLQADPYEFRDLSEDQQHSAKFKELKTKLHNWRKQTKDPLLDQANLRRLKAEIDACFIQGTPDKSRLELSYPDYFFASDRTE